MQNKLFFLLISLLLFACGGSDEPAAPEPYIQVTSSDVKLPEKVNGFSIISFISAADWKAELIADEGTPDWLKLNSKEGKPGSNHLRVTVLKENTTAAERTAILRITSGNLQEDVILTQSRKIVDGKVVKLQSATVGKGVDVIFMGDGFTEKDMGTGGKYEKVMKEAMGYFFDVEPTRTYRDYFNVYLVEAISKDGFIGVNSKTVFSTKFGEGSLIKGSDETVFQYASKIKSFRHDCALVVVILNSSKYAGVTMNYSDGASIVYCPMSKEAYPLEFRGVLQHETVGHALGKLLDEYVENQGMITADGVKNFYQHRDIYKMGWNLTVKQTDIPWKHFMNHPNYPLVGLYEGGFLYKRGVWRAEEKNCMINNIPYFNGPCRELIVKRILSIAGEDYSWDEFLKKDKEDSLPQNVSSREAQFFIPLAPPQFVDKTVEDLLKE